MKDDRRMLEVLISWFGETHRFTVAASTREAAVARAAAVLSRKLDRSRRGVLARVRANPASVTIIDRGPGKLGSGEGERRKG